VNDEVEDGGLRSQRTDGIRQPRLVVVDTRMTRVAGSEIAGAIEVG
jgi:hypothetical protein